MRNCNDIQLIGNYFFSFVFFSVDLVNLGNLKNDLWKLIKLSPITGLEHHDILMKQSGYIPTGIKRFASFDIFPSFVFIIVHLFFSFDELLGGGLLTGSVIDVCGISACGKTQFYTTIAVNWAINHGYETLVVDTNGRFSGNRINQILLGQGIQDADQRKRIMRHIRVEPCNSPLKLIEMLTKLLGQMHTETKCKLFVIDSLPVLWFLFHGQNRSLGNRKLATLADLLRKLAVEHAIVVLTVNIETRAILPNGTYLPI